MRRRRRRPAGEAPGLEPDGAGAEATVVETASANWISGPSMGPSFCSDGTACIVVVHGFLAGQLRYHLCCGSRTADRDVPVFKRSGPRGHAGPLLSDVVIGADRGARSASGSARCRRSRGSAAGDGDGRPGAAGPGGCGGRACARRRCSVRSLMRCVSMAIWTSGEPVSPSWVAYSVMICCLTAVKRHGRHSPSRGFSAVHQGISTWALSIRGRSTAGIRLSARHAGP